MKLLNQLFDELPEELERQVLTHASWSERSSDSYTRLAFLGDSVLGLAVTAHLYPRLEAERFGVGSLTKIRAQAVSGASCRVVAERLEVSRRLREAAPAGVEASMAAALVETERVLASVIEAVIGACYLQAGYERTAAAVVEAFGPEIEQALEHPLDFKSALQELLARRGT
jgi:ribonuclease-3